MKTKTENHQLKIKNRSGLENRNEKSNKQRLPLLDFQLRRNNRALATNKLLEVLRGEAPDFWYLAEVVGKWVWIQFKEKQPRQITNALSQLGFHWNNSRQTWQHPCGLFRHEAATFDPRKVYGSYFPADLQTI